MMRWGRQTLGCHQLCHVVTRIRTFVLQRGFVLPNWSEVAVALPSYSHSKTLGEGLGYAIILFRHRQLFWS